MPKINATNLPPNEGDAKPGTPPALANSPPTVPEAVRAMLGPSWLIEGEDSKFYEELLARVGAAVQPTDIIDWLLLNDVVALTWEIQRSRRQRETVVRLGRLTAITEILQQANPPASTFVRMERNDEIESLASKWLTGDTKATKRVLDLLSKAGFSESDVAAHALTVKASVLDRIDAQCERHEARRDSILRQIERRRDGFAQRFRRAAEEAVDAEFVEAPSIAPALGSGDERDGP